MGLGRQVPPPPKYFALSPISVISLTSHTPDFHSNSTDAALITAIKSVVQQNTKHHQNNHSQFVPHANFYSSKWRKKYIHLTFLVAGGLETYFKWLLRNHNSALKHWRKKKSVCGRGEGYVSLTATMHCRIHKLQAPQFHASQTQYTCARSNHRSLKIHTIFDANLFLKQMNKAST